MYRIGIDVGGTTPGSTAARARSVYEESLRIPILRVARTHQADDDLINRTVLNSRLSKERAVDLRVQTATNDKGVAATRELIRRMGGVPAFGQAIEDVFAYTVRRVRRCIAVLAPGCHAFTTWLDDDGSGEGGRVPIITTVFIERDTPMVDLAGTRAQSRGVLNAAESALRATVHCCVKAMLDREQMVNSGLAEAIVIRVSEGSIVSPRSPAACGARTITCQGRVGAIFDTFRSLVSCERLIASGNDTLPSNSFSGRHRGDLCMCIVCEVRALLDGTIFSARHLQGAAGAEGGGEGGYGRWLCNPGCTNQEVLASKVTHPVLAKGGNDSHRISGRWQLRRSRSAFARCPGQRPARRRHFSRGRAARIWRAAHRCGPRVGAAEQPSSRP